MSSTADWFSRRLNNPQPTQPNTYTPPAPVQRTAPPNVWPSATPPQPAYTQPEYQGPPTDEKGQVRTGDAIAHWQGGPGVRASKNSGGCPNCASGNYFPMGQAGNRCFDCGYPKMQGEVSPNR